MVAETGKAAVFTATVGEGDYAHALGNPGVHVLATPRLADFCDRAAAQAAGAPTTHIRVDIRHLAATPVGDDVEITAELVEVDGRRLVFSIAGRDSARDIVSGHVERLTV